MNRKSLSAAGRWPAIVLAAMAAGLVSFATPGLQGSKAARGVPSQDKSPAAAAPSRPAAAPVSAPVTGAVGEGLPSQGSRTQAPLRKATGAELAREYAAWKLEALTRSSGSEARASLRTLRDRVRMSAESSPAEARLVDLLTSIEVRLIIAMMGAGDTEGVAKALAALEAGAAPDGTSAPSESKDAPASSPLAGPVARARRAALLTPEVRALLDSRNKGRIKERSNAAAEGPGAQDTPYNPADAAIDRYVREAVARGAADFIQQLGPRATASLRDISLAIDGQMLPPGSVDALASLMEIDPAMGLQVASQMAATNDILIKRRVAVALQNARPLESPSMWRPSPDLVPSTGRPKGDEPTSPYVTATIMGLLAEPGVRPHMLREFGATLYRRGWIPKELEAAMPAILGPYLETTKAPHVGSVSMLKTALKDTAPTVRAAAVRALRDAGELSPTYALASDPSAKVRHEVALGLGPWTTSRRMGSLPADIDHSQVLPAVDADYEKALLSLFAADASDPASRSAIDASLALITQDETRAISSATLAQLAAVAKDPHVIGGVMAYATKLGEDSMGVTADAILGTLQDAPAESTGQAVAFLLAPLASIGTPDAFWASLTKAQDMGLIPEHAASNVLDQVRTAAFRHPRRMGAALDWLKLRAEPALWQRFYFADSTPPNVPDFIREFTVGFGSGHLEPFVQALGRIPGADPDQLMPIARRRLSGAMAERLLEDRTMTPEARIWLVKTLISRGQHTVSDPAKTTQAILDAYVAAGRPHGEEAHLAYNGIDSALFLMAALERVDLKDDILLDLDIQVEDPEAMDEVFKRFPPETWSKLGKRPLLQGATTGIMRSERPDRIELMTALVRVDEELAITVVEEIRCKGRPQDFELLEVVFESVRPGTDAWSIALDAATNFLDDAAVELLLELARRPYDHKSTRAEIMAAVDIIQNWQAAERRFTEGLAPAAIRAGVIEELVTMIGAESTTEEARAAALKGLGHLHASDQLPLLIKALSDPSEMIQEAARHALKAIDGSK